MEVCSEEVSNVVKNYGTSWKIDLGFSRIAVRSIFEEYMDM